MDAELAEIAGDPLAPELFGHGGGGARAAEEIGDEVAFVGAEFDDAFEESCRLLGCVASVFPSHWINEVYISPHVINNHSLGVFQMALVAVICAS